MSNTTVTTLTVTIRRLPDRIEGSMRFSTSCPELVEAVKRSVLETPDSAYSVDDDGTVIANSYGVSWEEIQKLPVTEGVFPCFFEEKEPGVMSGWIKFPMDPVSLSRHIRGPLI